MSEIRSSRSGQASNTSTLKSNVLAAVTSHPSLPSPSQHDAVDRMLPGSPNEQTAPE